MSDSESANSNLEASGDEWSVERIEDKRRVNGKLEYFIKWKNFPTSQNSWEPEKNCEGCEEAIADFERRHAAEKKTRQKEKSRSTSRRSASRTSTASSNSKKRKFSRVSVDESDSASLSLTSSRNPSVTKEAPAKVQVSPAEAEEAAEEQNQVLPEPVEAEQPAEEPMEVEQPVLAPAPAIDYSLDSSYRVVNGAKVKKITGVSNVRPEEVMVIVEYDDKGIEAVPSRILRNYFSSKLIDFYESKLDFRHL